MGVYSTPSTSNTSQRDRHVYLMPMRDSRVEMPSREGTAAKEVASGDATKGGKKGEGTSKDDPGVVLLSESLPSWLLTRQAVPKSAKRCLPCVERFPLSREKTCRSSYIPNADFVTSIPKAPLVPHLFFQY